MLEKNNVKTTEETVEGFKILVENATELNKKEFFKILAGTEEGLILTIERVGNTYISKFKNNKGKRPSMCAIDYSFKHNSKNYEIGIHYSLGLPIAEETFKLTSDMNITKILAVTNPDIKRAKKFEATKRFIEDSLTGIKFRAEIGTSFNGGFLIEPVELLED